MNSPSKLALLDGRVVSATWMHFFLPVFSHQKYGGNFSGKTLEHMADRKITI
jgi:hypothetical protein